MVDAIRWGILATGGIAHTFAEDLIAHGHQVTAVGSRSQAKADAFAAEFGIASAHGSYSDLAANPNVDIIYVATPHPSHAGAALLALNAGKHVLVEKPFTMNAAEARRVYECAAERKLLAMEAMWTRWLPHMIRVREIIASGIIGEVRTLIVDHTQSILEEPEHRLNNLELGGGALLDLGIYPISFSSDLLGTPATILASASFNPVGADDQVATIFRHAGGQLTSTVSASKTLGPNVASILGTKGRIDLDDTWYAPTSFSVYDSENAVLERYESAVSGRGMQFEAAEAERLIRQGSIESELLPTSESISIMETLDEIRRQIGLRYPGE